MDTTNTNNFTRRRGLAAWCFPLSRHKQNAPSRVTAVLAALGAGVLILGSPLAAQAENPPGSKTLNRPSFGFPLGIDPNEKEFPALRKAIREAVSRALPQGMTVERVFVSNDHFDARTREMSRKMGFETRLYARLYLTRDGQEYAQMDITVTTSEEQAGRKCAMVAYPYGQSKSHIAVLFTQRGDWSDYDIIIDICKRLGLSRTRNVGSAQDMQLSRKRCNNCI